MPRPRNDTIHHGPTATVRVTAGLAKVLEEECRLRGTAAVLAPFLAPWIDQEFRLAGLEIHRMVEEGVPTRTRGRLPAKAAATIRLPLRQLRALGIIAEVRDRWVGELVEEQLWKWVAEHGRSKLAQAALSKRGGEEKDADPGERVLAGAGEV